MVYSNNHDKLVIGWVTTAAPQHVILLLRSVLFHSQVFFYYFITVNSCYLTLHSFLLKTYMQVCGVVQEPWFRSQPVLQIAKKNK